MDPLRLIILFVIFDVSFPAPMGSFPVPAIVEVEFKGGSAHATHEYHVDPNYTPDKAFILGHFGGWYMGAPAPFPATVWYEFPSEAAFVPARVSFRTRQEQGHLDEGPTVWQFVGTNDPQCGRFSKWTVLCEDTSNAPFPNKHWTKYCNVDDKIVTTFKCLGISVLNTRNAHGVAALKDVRMWKKEYQ